MKDILERLRDYAPACQDMQSTMFADILHEAADEIHRLRTSCGHCGELEAAFDHVERLRGGIGALLASIYEAKDDPKEPADAIGADWLIVRLSELIGAEVRAGVAPVEE